MDNNGELWRPCCFFNGPASLNDPKVLRDDSIVPYTYAKSSILFLCSFFFFYFNFYIVEICINIMASFRGRLEDTGIARN